MIDAFSAVSSQKDAFKAGREAAETSMAGLGKPTDLLWLFGAVTYDQARLLAGVRSVAGNTPLIGCTTDGEISKSGLSTDSVVALALGSGDIRFHIASVDSLAGDSFRAGADIGDQLRPFSCRYLQLFSDPLSGNATRIIDGVKSVLGRDVKIAGGAAGDGSRFTRTWQYHNDRLLTEGIVAVGFEGDFHFGAGVGCGWFPVGTAKTVTRSEGNVVYELDGQPALSVYERFLGRYASRLPAVGVEYPLGLLGPQGDVGEEGYFLCRATMGVDRESGSITFAGDVPQGATVKMTMGSENDVLDAARKAASDALAGLKNGDHDIQPKAVFIYSCMARKIVLGSKTHEEILAVQKILGPATPVIGFYTYGEYAPIGNQGISHFHNETITLTVLGD